jgi:hypothetical protein
MERPGLTKVSMNRCEKLRWKGLYIEALEDPSIPPNNERSFWCQHTWNCIGPDGQLVDDFECSPARTCYEPL